MRQKVSIDSIDRYYRYRSIDPSPIVPIYGRWQTAWRDGRNCIENACLIAGSPNVEVLFSPRFDHSSLVIKRLINWAGAVRPFAFIILTGLYDAILHPRSNTSRLQKADSYWLISSLSVFFCCSMHFRNVAGAAL
jgi:hypothetical protein